MATELHLPSQERSRTTHALAVRLDAVTWAVQSPPSATDPGLANPGDQESRSGQALPAWDGAGFPAKSSRKVPADNPLRTTNARRREGSHVSEARRCASGTETNLGVDRSGESELVEGSASSPRRKAGDWKSVASRSRLATKIRKDRFPFLRSGVNDSQQGVEQSPIVVRNALRYATTAR